MEAKEYGDPVDAVKDLKETEKKIFHQTHLMRNIQQQLQKKNLMRSVGQLEKKGMKTMFGKISNCVKKKVKRESFRLKHTL